METIEIGDKKYEIIKWVDAHFYPRRHKSGFHFYSKSQIKDRHLEYNSKKGRWEEPILKLIIN